MSVLQTLPQRYFSRDIFNSYPTGRGPQTVDSVYVPGSVGLQPSWSVGENHMELLRAMLSVQAAIHQGQSCRG